MKKKELLILVLMIMSSLWLIEKTEIQKNNNYLKGYDKFSRLTKGFILKKDVFINLKYFIENSDTNYLMTEWEFQKVKEIIESDLEMC